MQHTSRTEQQRRAGFDHEAVFYEGLDGLVSAVLPFIREGVGRGEPVLVALRAPGLDAVERALGPDAIRVDFVDMGELGANPACIIPEWRRFLEDTAGEGPVRGVGEPLWAGRREVEMQEVLLHEALVNLAFEHESGARMLCAYDLDVVSADVVEDLARTHSVASGAAVPAGGSGPEQAHRLFSSPLPPAPADADTVPFGRDDLAGLRAVVGRLAEADGVPRGAADDLVLAAHELATNSVVHGSGGGVLRSWSEADAFVVEVSDLGVIEDPLVGRDLLDELSENGRGIWMANQLCDLVQVRSGPAGTVVRLYAWR